MVSRTVNGVKAAVVNDNDGDEVILLTDIKEHQDSSTCDCKPRLENQPNGDFLCIHNSYDNREENEGGLKC